MKTTTTNSNKSLPNKSKIEFLKELLHHLYTAIVLWLNPDERVRIMISRARKDERETVENEWKQKYNDMLRRMEQDKSYALQEKDAKIESLKKTIEERDLQLKNVEEIFNYCWEQTKANMNLASELKIQVWRAQKNQTDTYQAITNIVSSSEDYMQELKNKEARFKQLLGWKGL